MLRSNNLQVLFILTHFYCIAVFGSNIDTNYQFDQSEANYCISAYCKNSSLNPGDTVEISIFIIGSGIVNKPSIHLNIPQYLSSGKVLLETFTVFYKNNQIDNCVLKVDTIPPWGGRFWLPESYFTEFDYQPILGSCMIGGNNKYYTPISVKWILNHKAPSGEHCIHLKLLYNSNGKNLFNEKTITIKVNSFAEMNQPWILALLSILLVYAPLYHTWVNNKFKKILFKVIFALPVLFLVAIIIIMLTI